MKEIIEFLHVRLDEAQKIAAKRKKEDALFMQKTQNMIHDIFGKRYILNPAEMDSDEIEAFDTEPIEVLPEYKGPWELWIEEISVNVDKPKVLELVKNYLHNSLEETKRLLFVIPAFIDTVYNVDEFNLKTFCHALASNGVTTSLRRPASKETWVVRLYEFGNAKNKLSIVKAVNDAGDFPGLKEAKEACDKAALELVPVLITKDRKKADELCELIEEFGAKYSLTNQ